MKSVRQSSANTMAKASLTTNDINYDTLDSFVGYQLKRAFNIVQADLRDTLSPFELRMLTYTALVLIADNPHLSQSQLAAAMDIERANMVVIVDELESRQLIVRDRVPSDRRAYALNITLAGRRLVEKAIAAVVKHESRLFAGLDKDSRDLLITALSAFQGSHTR